MNKIISILVLFFFNLGIQASNFELNELPNNTGDLNLYLGASNNLKSPNLLYLHLGLRIPLGKKRKTFFSADYYYSSKNIAYTLYTKDDYAFRYQRNSILLGIDFNLINLNKWKSNFGISFTQAFLDGKLKTSDPVIKQVIQDDFNSAKSSISLNLLNSYNVNKRIAIYNKINLNLTEITLFSQLALTVGVNYQVFKTPTLPKLPTLP